MLNNLVIYPPLLLIDNIRRVIDHRKLIIKSGKNVKNKLFQDNYMSDIDKVNNKKRTLDSHLSKFLHFFGFTFSSKKK